MGKGKKEKEGGGLGCLGTRIPPLGAQCRIYNHSDPQTWSTHIHLSLSNQNTRVLGLKHIHGKGERGVSVLPLIFAAYPELRGNLLKNFWESDS